MSADDQNDRTKNQETPTQRALRASELSYRRLFETAQDGILILAADTGRITDVNPFLFKLLGFTPPEMLGKTVGELSPFKDMESNQIMLERLQRVGYVRYEDLPLETSDGRKIAVEFVSNVYQAGGQKVIQCNVRDITERKAAEKERSRLAAIIEYSQDAIVSKTASGIIIGWNRGAERLYGYTAEEILGRSVSILFPADRYAEYLKIMADIARHKTVPPFDTMRKRKDGVVINVSVEIASIEDRDGEVTGATNFSHDITRLKKLEAQFIEAQKMEVIGQLAGGVAHDFNNILAVILGYTALTMETLGPEAESRENLEAIRLEAERAVGLTQQLLVFSRKQTVQAVVLVLNDVLKDLEKMLRRLIDENITMTILPGARTGCIKADSGYISQVLMNLVINARDAMPAGGSITIATGNVTLDEAYVRAHPGTVPGRYVMLSIQDTGSGMTDDAKAHLFEAFFTTKPKGKGTGLGLATCRTIVQQSCGHIDVVSELGRGATFKIYFPRVPAAPLAAAPSPLKTPLPRGAETLLLVEDEPSVRHLAQRVLEAQGYEVLSASNGKEALNAAQDHQGSPISLVITDVVMPQMGGREMAAWLKNANPDLKILFTSGYIDEAITLSGPLPEGIQFLPKPYTPATLVRKVREMLDDKIPALLQPA